MAYFATVEDLLAAIGRDLGEGPPVTVGQATIDAFADVTGDDQWIHVDPDRAARESPFGGTVAHGFLTLSLFPRALDAVFAVGPATGSLNYGLGRVRFPAPVPAGAVLRPRFRLVAAETAPGGVRCTIEATMAIEGGPKPACVAEMIVLVMVPEGRGEAPAPSDGQRIRT
jgi:acyl dehydratase